MLGCKEAGGGSTQLTLELDGKTVVVEVDLDAKTVRVGDRDYPFTLVADKNGRAEVEIAGEKVVVDGWPDGLPVPPGPLAIDGESIRVGLDRTNRGEARYAPPPRLPSTEARPTSPTPAAALDSGSGTAVFPPMPGRVVEVLVAEGARVGRGDVLLVLEAMKMRNEIAAPITGVVRDLSVKPGTNVRARERMLRVVPDPAG
ncbi:MAG: biotin/lipoyl-binding protein [Thermoplasmata archaeon]|nr:biotin/lipoyl-binding protein [Thermoplasmata archaeon]